MFHQIPRGEGDDALLTEHCDQYLRPYSLWRKTKNGRKKKFSMTEVVVINAYILFCQQNLEFSKNQNSYAYFRKLRLHELVQTLLDIRADPDVAQQEVREGPTVKYF